MKRLYILSMLFVLGNLQSMEPRCQEKIRLLTTIGVVDPGFEKPCPMDPCDRNSPPLDSADEDCPRYCGLLKGKCSSKVLRYREIERRGSGIRETRAMFQQAAQSAEAERMTSSTSQRNFAGTSNPSANGATTEYQDLFLSSLHGYGCNIPNFPLNCGLNLNDEEALSKFLEPPLNVPYCQRNPCNSSDSSIETNWFACQSNPGCYFDRELSYRRQGFAYNSLPGVPVCYQAIQNANFMRLANSYTQRSGQTWNTLYTKCLIEQNLQAIEEPHFGCHVIKFLKEIGVHPKIAGWKGIGKRDCFLINGCYFSDFNVNGYNCFHPSNVKPEFNSVEGVTDSVEINREGIYGRQVCQAFNERTPESYLESYHRCKISGCRVDSSVTDQMLQNQMLNIVLSEKVPSYIRPYIWAQVKAGVITPGNWKVKLKNFAKQKQTPPSTGSNILSESLLSTFNEQLFRALMPVRQRIDRASARSFSSNQSPRAFSLDPCSILESSTNFNSIPFPPTVPPTPGIVPFIYQYPYAGPSVPSGVVPSFSLGSNPVSTNVQTPLSSNINPIAGSLFSQSGTSSSSSYPLGNPVNLQGGGSSPLLSSIIGSAPISSFLSTNVNLQDNPLLKLLCLKPPSLTECPYQNFNFGNYPPLKGSFSGCCKHHLCYTPKSQTSKQLSGLHVYWSEFGEWSRCDKPCGGGTRRRSRVCEKPLRKFGKCEGPDHETETCNTQSCAGWSQWSKYSQCSATCGNGAQTRSRSCLLSDASSSSCKGKKIETRNCNAGTCPVYGPWGRYSPCGCGKGVQTRQRECIRNCANAPSTDVRERTCERFCGTSRVVSESSCNPRTCSKVRVFECRTSNTNLTPHCVNFTPQKTLLCFDVYPCNFCPRSYSLQACQSYLGIQ